tara:strand:- start:178 stop:339 length:162 start_codon:yes stop_codon:yes gene_type:complete
MGVELEATDTVDVLAQVPPQLQGVGRPAVLGDLRLAVLGVGAIGEVAGFSVDV